MKKVTVPITYRYVWDHYEAELGLLNLRIQRLMASLANPGRQDDPMDSFRGIVISEQEIHELLHDPPDLDASSEVRQFLLQEQELEADIAEKVEASMQQGLVLPLMSLSGMFQLNRFELQCIMLAFAIEIDRKYEKLFAYLQDDVTCKLPTIELALKLFCQNAMDRFQASNAFLENSKLFGTFMKKELASEYPKSELSRFLKLDDRIIAYLKGIHQLDEKILPFTNIQTSSELLTTTPTNQAQQSGIGTFLRYCRQQDLSKPTILKLSGPSGSGKKHYVKQFCMDLQKPLLMVHAARMASNEAYWTDSVDRIVREAKLLNATLCFDEADLLFQEEAKYRYMLDILLQKLVEVKGIHFCLFKSKPISFETVHSAEMVDWEIASPDTSERKEIWQQVVEASGIQVEADLDSVAGKFQFTIGQIIQSVETAKKAVQKKGMDQIDSAHLHEACYQQTRHKLSELTVKIKPQYGWNDLILAPAQKELLRDACNQYRFRDVVYNLWGFGNKISYGKGISMMFAGPPGTGKTMSAQVVANELGLEIYKIDLSQIVSKYIGETEKNLHQIFSQARLTSAILFFDEADSLFGKRSEISNAHDKYANTETSYLLQKMEEYDGVTILATNFAQNLDDAFNRRINFIVRFPFPDAGHRELIWRRFFPADAPIHKDVDFAYLAKTFDIAGGVIKNIVLSAAFLAANAGSPISMKHIITALIQEYNKMGKIVAKEQVEPFILLGG